MGRSPQESSRGNGRQASEALNHPLSIYVTIGAAFRLGLLGGALPPICDTTASAHGKTHIAHPIYTPDRGVKLIERTLNESLEWFIPEANILAGKFEGFRIEKPAPEPVPAIMQDITLPEMDDDGPIIPAET